MGGDYKIKIKDIFFGKINCFGYLLILEVFSSDFSEIWWEQRLYLIRDGRILGFNRIEMLLEESDGVIEEEILLDTEQFVEDLADLYFNFCFVVLFLFLFELLFRQVSLIRVLEQNFLETLDFFEERISHSFCTDIVLQG